MVLKSTLEVAATLMAVSTSRICVRRKPWHPGSSIHIGGNGRMIYRRFANSIMEWEWRPSAADLMAEDWELIKIP